MSASAPAPRPRSVANAPAGEVLTFNGGDGGGGAAAIRFTPGTLVVMGVWMALVPTLMLFLSLVSAYIVRQGLSDDWLQVDLPGLLWLNTIVLAASSVTLEAARRAARAGREPRLWLGVTAAAGAAFLVGQVAAWRQLMAAGIDVGTTPYGSFFYVLSGVHALHVILALGAVLAATGCPERGWSGVSRLAAVRAASVLWHFLGVLWAGLLILLVWWR